MIAISSGKYFSPCCKYFNALSY